MFEGPIPDDIRVLLTSGPIVGHNLDFDLTVLLRYDCELAAEVFDTMLAARLLGLGLSRENLDYLDGVESLDPFVGDANPADNALDTVVRRYLGISIPKEIAKLGGSDWSQRELTELHRQYVRWDVQHLPPLHAVLIDELAGNNLSECFAERMEFLPNLLTIKMTGIPVSRDQCLADRDEVQGQKDEVREEIRSAFSFYRPEVPKSRRKNGRKIRSAGGKVIMEAEPLVEREEFNPHVPAQVVAALAVRGISVENTQRKTLERMDREETRLLVRYSLHKTRAMHIDGIVRSIFSDGRVRPASWNQLSAITGRITSGGPNLQNIPRAWRDAFVAPDPYQWLIIDLTQIEVYFMALHVGCTSLIELLGAGKDVYVVTIARIMGLEPVRGDGPGQVSDTLREVGKKLVLGTDYGLTIYGFVRQVEYATGIRYSLSEAQEFFDSFFAMYPEIAAYHEQCALAALTATEVRTITGQRRFLPPLKDDQNEQTGYWPSLEFRKRILLNTPIQGSCANYWIRSVNRFMPRLPEGAEVINLVHDEVNSLVLPEVAEAAKAAMFEAFDFEFRRLFGDRLPVKMKSYLGKSWADKQ
jgi:DNA polymerase I-like protein with 3'-5' exonuclease and polymerase domains